MSALLLAALIVTFLAWGLGTMYGPAAAAVVLFAALVTAGCVAHAADRAER